MQYECSFLDASSLKFIPTRTSRAIQQCFKFALVCALLLTTCFFYSAVAAVEEQGPMVPTIKVAPAVGPPTTYVLVSGSGFEPEEMIAIFFDATKLTQTLTGHGDFSVRINVPAKALPGSHVVTAKGTSGTQVRTNFLVRTDWAQFRFNSSHTGLNPYENVLSQTNVGLLVNQLQYQTGADVYSSPAVVGGVVYFGSQDRNLYALSASQKTLIWKYPTASFVTSSPAVVNGAVYVSDGTNMYALNAATGAELWKHLTGVENHCGSPTVVNGVWYWVGSGRGISSHVFAMDTSNGNQLWSYYIGIPEDSSEYCSSAAVAKGVVYVGAWDGNLYALDAKTGAFRWKYMTGGRIRSSPAVDHDVVYVGSDDFNLYALNASTGALLWKYRTGGLIFSSPAAAYGMVYVGSEDGNVYAVWAGTGTLAWKFGTGTYVSSSPAVANLVVYVGAAADFFDKFPIYALNATTGVRLWAVQLWSPVVSSPTVVDGVVYFGSHDGNLYGFGLPDGLLSKSDSPEGPEAVSIVDDNRRYHQ